MSSGFTTGCTAKTSGCSQNASMARKITVWPPMVRYCLGPPPPARRPRPAATRMAAVRLGLGIGLDDGRTEMRGGVAPSLAHSPYHAECVKTERFPIAVGKADFVA